MAPAGVLSICSTAGGMQGRTLVSCHRERSRRPFTPCKGGHARAAMQGRPAGSWVTSMHGAAIFTKSLPLGAPDARTLFGRGHLAQQQRGTLVECQRAVRPSLQQRPPRAGGQSGAAAGGCTQRCGRVLCVSHVVGLAHINWRACVRGGALWQAPQCQLFAPFASPASSLPEAWAMTFKSMAASQTTAGSRGGRNDIWPTVVWSHKGPSSL